MDTQVFPLVHSSSYLLPRWLSGKESAFQVGEVWSLDWEDPLENEMTTHSTTLSWETPWTEEPGGLQSMTRESDMT